MDVNKQNEVVTVFIQSVSNQDTLVLRKYNATGAITLNQQWSFGSFAGVNFTTFSAAGNNIFLTGINNNSFSLGTTTFPMPQAQYWAVRFGNTGAVTWSGQGKSTSSFVKATITTFAEDGSGNFYVGGGFSGTFSLTGTSQTLVSGTKTNGDEGELFYGKYNSAGNLVWLKQGAGFHAHKVMRMRVGSDNKIYMMGSQGSKRLYLGGDSTSITPVNSSNPYFLVQMDTSGNSLWLKRVN